MKRRQILLLLALIIESTSFGVPLLNEEQYDKILSLDQPVVITFITSWCPVCTDITRPMAKVASEHNDILFFEVDTDLFPALAELENVLGVPTFIFRTQGQEIKREVGVKKIFQFTSVFKNELNNLLISNKQLSSLNIQTSSSSWVLAQKKNSSFFGSLSESFVSLFTEPDTLRWIQL